MLGGQGFQSPGTGLVPHHGHQLVVGEVRHEGGSLHFVGVLFTVVDAFLFLHSHAPFCCAVFRVRSQKALALTVALLMVYILSAEECKVYAIILVSEKF